MTPALAPPRIARGWAIDPPKGIRIFLYIAIALSPIQNSSLQAGPLGYLGASPSFAPLTLYCALTAAFRVLVLKSANVEIITLAITAYTCIVSLFGLYLEPSTTYNTSYMMQKTFSNIIFNVILIYPVFRFPSMTAGLRASIYFAFTLSIVGYVLVDVFRVSGIAAPSLLKVAWGVTSPSGLSLELSTFAATIATLGLVSTAVTRGRIWKAILLSLVAIFVFGLSHSKGTTICLVLACGLPFITSSKASVPVRVLGLLAVTLIAYAISFVLIDRFEADLTKSTSSSTRSVLVLTGFVVAANYPLGVGYSGYFPAMVEYAPKTANLLRQTLSVDVNMAEYERYVSLGQLDSLNIKAQAFEYLAVLGIPGALLFFGFNIFLYYRLSSKSSGASVVVLSIFWFTFFAVTTYVPATGIYIFTLAYGILVRSAHRVGPEKARHPSIVLSSAKNGIYYSDQMGR
ncbi:hypothetical protein NS277_04235 [Novosphingobium barchaimii]|nr:hypothetical protein NS277_04235 [Novosphingobium barchaimii]